MAQCPNCKSRITCGCQRRKATDGAAVCTKCKSGYERELTSKRRTERQAEIQARRDAANAVPAGSEATDVRVQFIPNIGK